MLQMGAASIPQALEQDLSLGVHGVMSPCAPDMNPSSNIAQSHSCHP